MVGQVNFTEASEGKRERGLDDAAGEEERERERSEASTWITNFFYLVLLLSQKQPFFV